MQTPIRFSNTHETVIIRGLLVLLVSLIILYLFPKSGQFRYEYQKGRVWQYPTLYAPFDFSILKSEAELQLEQNQIRDRLKPYYRVDVTVRDRVFSTYKRLFPTYFAALDTLPEDQTLFEQGSSILETIYANGVLPPNEQQGLDSVYLVQNNVAKSIAFRALFNPNTLFSYLTLKLEENNLEAYSKPFQDLFFELISPNVSLDERFTAEAERQALNELSKVRDLKLEGELIIAEGQLIDENQIAVLDSLRYAYSLEKDKNKSYLWIVTGYGVLIVILFSLLLMFLREYRPKVFADNKQLGFILFNMVLILALTTVLIDFNVAYIFAVPFCILPLIIKSFFDARLGLFTHVLMTLLIGFIIPNAFEFIFLQIVAGIVTIQTTNQLHKRANLFFSVGQIVMVYIIAFIAFTLIQDGSVWEIDIRVVGLLLLNGLLTLFVQPLIYIFEKLFGLVSDVSLLELTDTNSPLLKQLADQAPGTFHHALQVANLAESAANEIGANALLVRVGALYHDIGKIQSPNYFTENQTGKKSPHDVLTPQESAKIIIAHVNDGVALAKKVKLPERIIDFIKTHHGTTTVYYFLKKAQEFDKEGLDKAEFTYPGPKPFSKETALLMMADAVEAASKSLRNPNVEQIQEFVNRIITSQMEQEQFHESNITLAEIETAKEVLIRKLINIYQLRIEYPE
ncbi:MAG: HD family phosphohydrolase [Flavobacteriaceae bacterium]